MKFKRDKTLVTESRSVVVGARSRGRRLTIKGHEDSWIMGLFYSLVVVVVT